MNDAAVAPAAAASEMIGPLVPAWLVASMLLGLGLGSVEDDVGQRDSDLGVLVATGFDGDVDELEEAIHLLGAEFDLDHIRPQCRQTQADPQPKPAQPEAASEARSSRAGAEEQEATTDSADKQSED